jgi:hypothetical protein
MDLQVWYLNAFPLKVNSDEIKIFTLASNFADSKFNYDPVKLPNSVLIFMQCFIN